MKWLWNASSLALWLLCGHLLHLSQSKPVGTIRGKKEDVELKDSKIDPNALGMTQARPDIGVDFDKFKNPFGEKRPEPNPCCEDHPGFADPAHTEYKDCMEEEGQQEVSRLKWSVRYLRAAIGSKPFEKCLRTAVQEKLKLKTSHEHETIGPYVPCCGPSMEDPDFILHGFNSKYLAYDVVMNTAKFAGSSSNRKLKLECKLSVPGSMYSPDNALNRWNYDNSNWGHSKTHLVQVNQGIVMAEYPTHAQGQDDWPEIFGTVGFQDYAASSNNYDGHSYPVDEIAGMILHEMLHNIKIEHGSETGNECYYDSYNCVSGSSGTCRANSLNEIAESCVSEVVEESIARCHPERCCHRWQLPIWVPPPELGLANLGTRRDLATFDSKHQFEFHEHWLPFGSCECESFW